MCLDIDPNSVIHKHLVNKACNINNLLIEASAIITLGEFEMLPSFHISLGAPLECNKSNPNPINLSTLDTVSLVGLIALAPINISKKDDKKSAWIPLYPTIFRLMQQNNVLPKYINLEPFNSMGKELHISLANLTGNPHDSIARPEDCIINTITA